MAITKLNFLFLVTPHNQTPLPTENPNLPLLHFKEPSTLSLKTQLNLPNLLPIKPSISEKIEESQSPFYHYCKNVPSSSVAFPSIAFSNSLFFASNVQLIVSEDEPEEKLISRFRREVMKAGVLRECRRRRFFECNQEKRKRKSRDAARRNRKRRPQPKVLKTDKSETSKKKTQDSDEDNWEFLDIDLPYYIAECFYSNLRLIFLVDNELQLNRGRGQWPSIFSVHS